MSSWTEIRDDVLEQINADTISSKFKEELYNKLVSEFLKICSKPKNLIIPRFTDGCNLNPPLYGPIALLN